MPMNETVLAAALILFGKVSVIVSGLVGMIFMMRMCFLVVRVANIYEYTDVLGGVVRYFGITAMFPMLVKLLISVTGSLALKISFVPIESAQGSINEFMQNLFGDFVFASVFGKIGDIIFNLLTQSIYTVFISLSLAIAPVVLFLSTMLGLSQGIASYFAGLLSLCLWPVLWNLLGLLGRELGPFVDSSPASAALFWIVIQLLQLFSPLFCVLLFRTLSPSQAISRVISVVG